MELTDPRNMSLKYKKCGMKWGVGLKKRRHLIVVKVPSMEPTVKCTVKVPDLELPT